MEESLCSMEVVKDGKVYIARIQSDLGGQRELRDQTLEGLLEQVIEDLREEFEAIEGGPA